MRTSSKTLTSKAVQRFSNNTPGMLSFLYIILCGCVAISCYLISPDNSKNANQMHLEIHSKSPGFTAQILEIPSQKKTSLFSKLICRTDQGSFYRVFVAKNKADRQK